MTARPIEAALTQWFGEFADQGILTTDEHLVITSWNRWLERRSGRASGELVGRPLTDAFPDLVVRGLDELYREAVAGHGSIVSHLLHRYLLPMPARVGSQHFAHMPQRARIAPLFWDGRVVGTVTVIDDVSERVASERELRRQIEAQELARTAAEKAVRVKDEFLATLSHEIRTPLNAVLGWARILRDRELDPGLLSRALDAIFRNATVQARMIEDLLDTARIMAGKLRLQMQSVDLLTVTIAALDVLSPVIEAKQLVLTRTLDANVGRVLGDPDRLQQVIWNLLSNAVKFTDPGGAIEVSLVQAGPLVRLSVTDNGKGIAPEILPFIFERFRQADTSSSRREAGLGLGLALVRELVELHGGAVRAASPGLGQGATFVVELPVTAPLEASGEAAAAPAGRGRLAPCLEDLEILVVDDNEDARELLKLVLSQAGARVVLAGSCGEALRCLRDAPATRRPDVLVSDIGMAGEDGYDLLRQVRSLPPESGGDLPAIAITAYAGSEDQVRVLAAGYQLHVTKPVDPIALIGAITRLVRPVDV